MNTHYWHWATYGMLLAMARMPKDMAHCSGWERVIVNHGYKVMMKL